MVPLSTTFDVTPEELDDELDEALEEDVELLDELELLVEFLPVALFGTVGSGIVVLVMGVGVVGVVVTVLVPAVFLPPPPPQAINASVKPTKPYPLTCLNNQLFH
jgi:hypothetical protein